jgi:hypothetical protein
LPPDLPADLGYDAVLTSDIGEGNLEEINIVEPGRDYGSPEREGTFAVRPDERGRWGSVYALDDAEGEAFTDPVASTITTRAIRWQPAPPTRDPRCRRCAGFFFFGDVRRKIVGATFL